MTNKFMLVGRKEDGSTVYYTGRAGSLFVSADESQAFHYDDIVSARHRAANLNQMTALHGILFHVPCNQIDADDWSIAADDFRL